MATTNPANKTLINKKSVEKNISSRDKKNSINKWLFFLCTLIGLVVLIALLAQTIIKGAGHLTPEFFTNFSSSTPADAGIKGALVGSIWLILSIIPITIILGIGTAIYLEEYARDNVFTQIVKVSISNLAGVPSIVFGLLGYTLFVGAVGMGNSVLAAALTMSLLTLPVIIVSSQEAIRAVPGSVREASYGLGANKWQTIRRVVLPAALPGILTGFILSLSRALGETAPLVVIGIPTILLATPNSLLDQFSALPTQIYTWAKMPQAEFQSVASAGIIVLLVILLLMNAVAVSLRNKFSKKF
ncbi:phosphate ABC transporter permease PstA [Staphylococcus saccharolyticus]|uniref:phosphate ABC transporter permease PstA n=1 Tax=Staphylococcus saccharolyticus TaxID=33028 RepID=UPI00102DB52D|nr:phosphate ABC transporter permease PstA [Staphylococcus saccharolyticus]MBL7573166.1 phosphate ABC transporter permease PstA [Staphylococcus saccharolyticus]MBL7583900.1 phosphate ABC transporter permease PstA [Staphylococcus saccharolyticus]MBL7638782.1 phosphate ABC transporter permease PstA [Staphylococcus saccharolyticus]QRJ67733.1 phosphate ABC transporter permease PstA [Staphylococcus saccharolyticus]TAA93691.1 phosphate ABC transporter permease PtsA [Staphylococcus saccharolyticus]